MKDKKEIKGRINELEELLRLMEKYKIYHSLALKNSIKGQITNMKWILNEEAEDELKWKNEIK
jgi:hypothetical protein